MTRLSYRAAGWISDDCQAEVRLTTEGQKDLSDAELLAAAEREAASMGLDMTGGGIVICEWTE